MKLNRHVKTAINAILVATMFGLTSCENGNLFGKLNKSGESGDPEVLNLDAIDALRSKDYSRALVLAEKVLAQNPTNAQALYTAASAAIGSSGLNFGQLVANILNQSSAAPSINGVGDYISAGRESVKAQAATADSILAGIDLNALNNVIDRAICRLQLIVAGAADGSIPSNDISVLMDFASLCLVRAVLRPLRDNLVDIANNNGTYDIVYQIGDVNELCTTYQATTKAMISDVVSAYALFNRAVQQLNLSGNQIIVRIRDDIDEIGTKLLTDGGPDALPTACINLLNTDLGINVSNFKSNLDAFIPPASAC